jgi:hypothetical protein
MIVQSSNRRRRFSTQWLSFVIVSHSSWLICLMFVLIASSLICICSVAFVSSNDLCRLQNDQVFLSKDLKMIKSFCQMISKRSCSLRLNFLKFSSSLRYLFRAQFVHAKTTLSCDRRYYRERDDDRWWWSTNDVTRVVLFLRAKCFHALRFHNLISLFSSNFYMLVVIIISCLSRWSYCAICLRELFIVWDFMHSWECFVSNYQSFFINVSFEESTMSSSFA